MYLTFAITYGVPILEPSITDGCLYQQYLVNSLSAPASRRNYTSGARIWIEERGGDGRAMRSLEADHVAKGGERLDPHTPNPAPALMPADLVLACRYLDRAAQGAPIKAALCVGYFAFLRTSNLLTPNAIMWGGPHTLQRADIISTHTGLQVIIKSSKTLRPGTAPTVLILPRIPTSPACPATAWDRYVTQVEGSPGSPAFTTHDGLPLTTAQLVAVLQTALTEAGCPYAQSIRSHSMRRGGAWAAVAAGCNKQDIAAHGTWASAKGLRPYIPSQSSTNVARSLATLFAP